MHPGLHAGLPHPSEAILHFSQAPSGEERPATAQQLLREPWPDSRATPQPLPCPQPAQGAPRVFTASTPLPRPFLCLGQPPPPRRPPPPPPSLPQLSPPTLQGSAECHYSRKIILCSKVGLYLSLISSPPPSPNMYYTPVQFPVYLISFHEPMSSSRAQSTSLVPEPPAQGQARSNGNID